MHRFGAGVRATIRRMKTSNGRLTISAVSAQLGIPIPTIRSWERRYGFPTPTRTGGQHRRYSLDEVELLRMLRDEVTRGHRAREAVALVQGRAAVLEGPRPSQLDAFVEAAMRLDAMALRRTLDQATETSGVEGTIAEVALPALRELGTRWTTGTCDIVHEHLATEAVRSWIARQQAMAPPPFRAASLVLACGPKDLHSIGLEAFGLMLARHGWAIRALGPLTPAAALVQAVRTAGAAGAVITSQRSVTRRAAVEAISAVAAIPGVEVFFAGDAFAPAGARRDVPGAYLGTDLVEAVATVERALEPRGARRRT
jgi:MerR family transcriptional regulator, light-induced transcriptional regulator